MKFSVTSITVLSSSKACKQQVSCDTTQEQLVVNLQAWFYQSLGSQKTGDVSPPIIFEIWA